MNDIDRATLGAGLCTAWIFLCFASILDGDALVQPKVAFQGGFYSCVFAFLVARHGASAVVAGRAYGALDEAGRRAWDARVPSTLHALFATCCSVLLLGLRPDLGPPDALTPSRGSTFALAASAGYFAYDLTDLLASERAGAEAGRAAILVHHVVALVAEAQAIRTGQGHTVGLLLLATELTTPFLNLRWWLHAAGLSGSFVYALNGVLGMLAWGLGRLGLCALCVAYVRAHWHRVLAECTPLSIASVVVLPGVLTVLNLFWFAKLVRAAYRHARAARGEPPA